MSERASAIAAGVSILIANYRAEAMQAQADKTPANQSLFLAKLCPKLKELFDCVAEEVWHIRCQPVLEATQDVINCAGNEQVFARKFERLLDFAQEVFMLLAQHLAEQERQAPPLPACQRLPLLPGVDPEKCRPFATHA